jgi:hypothetical protein
MAAEEAEARWRLRCLYRRAAPAPELATALAAGVGATPTRQALLLAAITEDALAARLPRGAAYEAAVLTAAARAAERGGHALADALADALAARLTAPPDPAAAAADAGCWLYKIYSYAPACEPAAETEARSDALERAALAPPGAGAAAPGDARRGALALKLHRDMLAGGTGCSEWEAGFALAAFLFSYPELVRGRAVLELGAGAGTAGAAAWRAGARALAATDGNAAARAACVCNLRLNGAPARPEAAGGAAAPLLVEGGVTVRRLEWSEGYDYAAAAAAGEPAPEVVIGADLMYDPSVATALARAVRQALGARALYPPAARGAEPVAYLATVRRSDATLATYVEAAAAAGLALEDVSGAAAAGGVRFCWPFRGAGEIVVHRLALRD